MDGVFCAFCCGMWNKCHLPASKEHLERWEVVCVRSFFIIESIMKFENSTVKVFGAIALVVLVVLGFIVLDNWHGKEPAKTDGGSFEPKQEAVVKPEVNVGEATLPDVKSEASTPKDGGKGSAPRVLGSERSIQLSRLLDDETSHDKALTMALELADKGNHTEKLDALSAFAWLGGKAAMEKSIKMISEGDTIGARADQVVSHLIQENLMTGEPLMDLASWKALFNSLTDDSEIQSYMVLLSGYSLEESFPILLDLAESSREKIAEPAKEYLSSVAFGREFKDVEDAKTWYKQYQELQEKKAKEALKEAQE